jgi:hypothetical protein
MEPSGFAFRGFALASPPVEGGQKPRGHALDKRVALVEEKSAYLLHRSRSPGLERLRGVGEEVFSHGWDLPHQVVKL